MTTTIESLKKLVGLKTKVTEEQAKEAMAVYVNAKAMLEAVNAEMAIEVAEVRQKFEPGLDGCKIDMAAAEEVLRKYATDHKDDLFADKKSLEMMGTIIGWRKSPAKLCVLEGWTTEKVLKAMKGQWSKFIQKKLSVDKTALIKSLDGEEKPNSKLEAIGLKLEQNETFYIK